MAFRRSRLAAIGGFDPALRVAGDDVDVCWRLQARGWKLGFSPGRSFGITGAPRFVPIGSSSAVTAAPKRCSSTSGRRNTTARGISRGVDASIRKASSIRWDSGRQRIYQGTWGSAPYQSLDEAHETRGSQSNSSRARPIIGTPPSRVVLACRLPFDRERHASNLAGERCQFGIVYSSGFPRFTTWPSLRIPTSFAGATAFRQTRANRNLCRVELRARRPAGWARANVRLGVELLRFSDLECHYGAREVFSSLSGVFNHGERIGLVGPNGAGKSSLLRLLAGVDRPFGGTVVRAKGLKLGYLAQGVADETESTLQGPRRRCAG